MCRQEWFISLESRSFTCDRNPTQPQLSLLPTNWLFLAEKYLSRQQHFLLGVLSFDEVSFSTCILYIHSSFGTIKIFEKNLWFILLPNYTRSSLSLSSLLSMVPNLWAHVCSQTHTQMYLSLHCLAVSQPFPRIWFHHCRITNIDFHRY